MASLQIKVHYKRVDGQEHNWPVSAVFDADERLPHRQEGVFSLESATDGEWQQHLNKLSWTPDLYGEFLGKALFKEGVRDLFKQALSYNEPVQVFLNVEAPELKVLRWERLSFPDDDGSWTSLAQHQHVMFSAYFPSLVSRQYPSLNKATLEALVVIASPSTVWQGAAPFDVSQAKSTIATSFSQYKHPPTILSKPEEVNWESLKQTLNRKHYPILHIVAHGFYKADQGESYLLLLNQQGQLQPLSASAFIDELKRLDKLPNLIFLCSCETAKPEASQGAHGHFARRLLDELGTPAIIAMSDKVGITTAELLSKHFYAYLYEFAQVDQALAKAGLVLLKCSDRYLPVLYQRLGHRPLFTNVLKALHELDSEEIKQGLALLGGEDGLSGYLPERAPTLRGDYVELLKQLNSLQSKALDSQEQEAKDSQEQKSKKQILEALERLCQATTELGFSALAQGEKPSAYKADCPFPGLRPFRVSQKGTDYREFFFGREAKVQELCARLEASHVLMIKGDSGSGKSSLVYAGLLPELERRCQAEGKIWQEPLIFRPNCSLQNEQLITPLEQLQGGLARLDPTQTAVVFVDQFEELFTSCKQQAVKDQRELIQPFLDTLLAIPQQNPQWKLILTMRVDFSGDCAPYEELRKLVQNQAELLAPMNLDELRTAIECQVAKARLILEQGLLHSLLEKVNGEPGAMPLVQYSLALLWLRRRGRYLLMKEYEQTQKMGNAITSMAEAHFQSYTGHPAQAYLRNIYLRLTRPDSERQKLTTDHYRDTRQRVPKAELYPEGSDPILIDRLLQELADEERRLIVIYENSVEIAHEALIQYWPTLNGWLNNASLSLLRQGITESARDWQKEPNKPKRLSLLTHTGTRLQDIEKYRKDGALFLNEQELAYLSACHLEDRRRARNQRYVKVFAVVMVVLFLVAGLLSWFAIEQKNVADDLLAEQYFQKGMVLRDNKFQDWDKAEYYFAKALDVAKDVEQRERVEYALSDLKGFNVNFLFSMSHKKNMWGVQVFANDQRVLTWSEDGSARIWNSNTGDIVGVPMQHNSAVWGAQVFANDQRVLTWSEDGSARIWNANTGADLNISIHHKGLRGAQIFANDQRVFTWSRDGSARVWDANTGTDLNISIHHEGIKSAQIFANDQRVLTWSERGSAQVWNVNTGERVGLPITQDEHLIYGAKVVATGQRILTWGMDGTTKLWDGFTGVSINMPLIHGETIIGIQVFDEDQKLLTWGSNGGVRVWNLNTDELMRVPIIHQNDVWGAQIFSDITRILIWSRDSIEIRNLPQVKGLTNLFFGEVQQILAKRYMINSANKYIFLTKTQLEKCKTLYQPYQECNESDSNFCKVKRQWWSVQKFFGQLPTLEDCLN